MMSVLAVGFLDEDLEVRILEQWCLRHVLQLGQVDHQRSRSPEETWGFVANHWMNVQASLGCAAPAGMHSGLVSM